MCRALLLLALLTGACASSPAPDAPPDGSPAPKPPVVAPEVSATATSSAAAAASVAATASAAPTLAPEVPPPGFQPIPARRPKGFPGVAFAEVRGFAFDLEVGERSVCSMPLDRDGTSCETVVRPGVVLTPEQTKQLLAILGDKGSFGPGSKCFLPHHGFVFYDDKGVPVAEVSLCFMCAMGLAAPAIPVGRGGDGDGSFGLGEKSTGALRALCRDLGLPKCDAQRPDDFAVK